MKIIDLNTWERTEHYKFFRQMDYPQYIICSSLDITNFLKRIKEKGLPFYYTMIFAATLALNRVENFRYRIQGEDVVLYETIHPSFTDMKKGSDLFKMINVDMERSIDRFVRIAKERSDGQDCFIREDAEGRDDLVYITCIPWVSFTGMSHTISLKKDDCIPRLSWGKYYEDNGKMLLPFSIQAHHSFVDGLHMGRYYDCLQKYLNEFE